MAAVKLNISKNNLDNKPKQMSNNMDDGADIQALYREHLSIDDLLVFITEHKCSDLYITVGDYPYVSRFGKIYRVPSETISKEVWSNFYDKYILNELNGTYVHEKLLDTSVEIRIPDKNKDGTSNPNYEKFASAGNPFYRYRVSFGYSQEKNVATFRTIRPEKITFDDINYNAKCIEALRKAYAKSSGICYFTGPTGSGKALEKNTLIPTINGIKPLKDIKINDIIFDKNGKQTKVLGKYHPKDEKFYEFTFSDGTKVKSAEGHLWEVDLLNVWSKTPYTKQYYRWFTPDTLYKLQANTKNHIIINYQLIYNLIFQNNKTNYTQFKNFLTTFNVPIINMNNLAYISVDKLLQYSKSQERTDNLLKCNKKYITNNEAKTLLKTKFIKIIRNSDIEYISEDKPHVYLDEFCHACLNYYNDISVKIENSNQNIKAILTTHDIVANGLVNNANRLNFAITRSDACEYNNVELPIKPYSFGFWLGDGNKDRYKVSKMYKEPMLYIKKEYPETIITEDTYSSGKTGYIAENKSLRKVLQENNLYKNKHIPQIYENSSINDKLLLLAGLIDSDGYLDEYGICYITLTLLDVIKSIRKICCSLGFKCSKISNKIGSYTKDGVKHNTKENYTFSFIPTMQLPLQVKHKKKCHIDNINSNKSQQIRHKRFYLTDIKEISGNNNDYYCLSVDSNTHTFLCTESYLPTHNSTTMAACINTFTKPNELLDNKVFITLEDPIENLFDSTDSVKISQKELGKDFKTFALGIKAALREHPNQILVGECRDKEVICAAIEAARTGHVTSTTFHASDVAGTLNRLMYHLDNDKNLSLDLILQLNIIMAQKMLKSEGKYLVDTQYMVFDDKVTKRLVDILDTPDANLSKEVNKMFEDQELLELGLVKDWDYKHLH